MWRGRWKRFAKVSVLTFPFSREVRRQRTLVYTVSSTNLFVVPTGDLHANAALFRMGVLANNLFIGFNRERVPVPCQSFPLRSLRRRIFSPAGRIVTHARSLALKLAVDAASLNLLSRIRGQCLGLFGST